MVEFKFNKTLLVLKSEDVCVALIYYLHRFLCEKFSAFDVFSIRGYEVSILLKTKESIS